jgi:phage protein D
VPLDLGLLSGKERAPAECVIEVDHAPIEDLYPFLIEATVQAGRADAATATLTFESRRDELGQWLVQDAHGLDPREPMLAEWKPILIKAVFGVREEEVFRGFIRQVKAEYPPDAGNARVTVECQDDSLQLDRTHRRKAWGTEQLPTSDQQILMEVLSSYAPLTLDVESAAGQSGLVNLNQDGTDIAFLKSRAEANGYELLFRGGTVYFGPMRLQGQPQDTLLVYAGADTNCLSLNATTDSHQADAVAFDVPAATGSESTERTVEPDLPVLGSTHATSAARGLTPFTWKLSGEAGADETRLQAQAQRKANEFDIQKVQAEGELDGTRYGHVLLAGRLVPVDGLGDRFSGTYYVDSVTHAFNTQGYRQRFKLLRNAFGDDVSSVSALAGALSAIF